MGRLHGAENPINIRSSGLEVHFVSFAHPVMEESEQRRGAVLIRGCSHKISSRGFHGFRDSRGFLEILESIV